MLEVAMSNSRAFIEAADALLVIGEVISSIDKLSISEFWYLSPHCAACLGRRRPTNCIK